jgi:hypothetical protein
MFSHSLYPSITFLTIQIIIAQLWIGCKLVFTKVSWARIIENVILLFTNYYTTCYLLGENTQ